MEQIKGQTTLDDFLGGLMASVPPKPKARKKATSTITEETRILSYKQTEKQPLRQRVLDTLDGHEMSAREIAVEMHKRGLIPYPARAVIQPRITELVEAGVIKAVGDKWDTMTERKVAVYKVV